MTKKTQNKLRKALLLVCSAMLLVSITVVGTVAYLTAQTNVVENTFTVGNVSLDPEMRDGLDEAKVDLYGNPVDANGNKVAIENAPRVTKNEYKLLPGHEYVKDPTVTVAANSEEAYVRMIVTITDLADVKAVFGADETTGFFLPQNFVGGWDNSVWVSTNEVIEENDTATYEFWYKTTVNTLDGEDLTLEPLFTSIIVPEDITNENLAQVDDMEIKVIAHAIQADGFADAEAAWAEFN